MTGLQRFLLCSSLLWGACSWCPFPAARGFAVVGATSSRASTSRLFSSSEETEAEPSSLPLPTKVAVTGATGRTGSLVVQELWNRDHVQEIVAVVRDKAKAMDKFMNDSEPFLASSSSSTKKNLTIVECDLTDESDIEKAIDQCDAVIWCATGFSDANTSVWQRIKRLLGIALSPKTSIDYVGVPTIGKILKQRPQQPTGLPQVVMLSSAGVTRPGWDDEKKAKYPASADIPIVRLNPFGILDVKAESEEKLRETGVDYTIVRPTGLNDKWPSGCRPVLSQGDVAVGRINRQDVAKVLVDVLSTPEAVGKTFEVLGLYQYPPAASIAPALSRLIKDSDGPLSEEAIAATYATVQQLIPGETQDPAALAMGQTYEQLDKGETGRLGERGTEDAEGAAPKPTSS